MITEKKEPQGHPEIEMEDFAPEDEEDVHSESTIYFDKGVFDDSDGSIDTRTK